MLAFVGVGVLLLLLMTQSVLRRGLDATKGSVTCTNAFYNPGGPGPKPFEDVRFTAPGPSDVEPVIIALDVPMRVDRAAP
jgi:hypothetical protein